MGTSTWLIVAFVCCIGYMYCTICPELHWSCCCDFEQLLYPCGMGWEKISNLPAGPVMAHHSHMPLVATRAPVRANKSSCQSKKHQIVFQLHSGGIIPPQKVDQSNRCMRCLHFNGLTLERVLACAEGAWNEPESGVANALLCAAELSCTAVLQSEAESIWVVVVASALHCSGQSAGEPEAPTLTFLLLQIGLETNGGGGPSSFELDLRDKY